MAITYKYKINNVRVYSTDDLTDIVSEVDYTYTASEGTGDNKVEASHDFMIALNEPDKDNFKAFNDLTEADVRNFVKSVADVEGNKYILNSYLEAKKAPVKVDKALPWA
tara:strand:- start:1394 stop:1720 length:327 start_codon:yes stop_codon:yes gene_type:complete